MALEDLTWLATELGLPHLREAGGGVVANEPALAALQEERPSELEQAAAVILGVSARHQGLCGLIAGARRGERGSALIGASGSAQGFRVVAGPAGVGVAEVTIAPASIEQSGVVQRRANLVDVAAAVSHEVANAMSAIGGWAELAARGGHSGIDAGEALSLIASCARTAEQAARRMLSLARGESENDVRTDVSELADEVTALLTLTARQARVTLEAEVEPGLHVIGSRAQLFTILWNLTKNAIEACDPTGSVRVQIFGDDEHVHTEVRDTGAGLDAEQQSRIFARYYTTKAGGTGLGLALVRDAIGALGGSIALESSPGRGTVFRVTLPRVTRISDVHGPVSEIHGPSAGTRARVQSEEAPTGGAHLLDARILVVDDDDALREMVATALSLRGARVTTVRGSVEARELEGSFDVALVDMMLDDGRGDELLAQLRKRGVVNAAMLVTGSVQKARLVPGGEPDDWVRKPFELSHLVDRLRRTLERHRMLSTATATMRF